MDSAVDPARKGRRWFELEVDVGIEVLREPDGAGNCDVALRCLVLEGGEPS